MAGACVAWGEWGWEGLGKMGWGGVRWNDQVLHIIAKQPTQPNHQTPRDFYFTDKRTLLAGVKSRSFLEAARVESMRTLVSTDGGCSVFQGRGCMSPRRTQRYTARCLNHHRAQPTSFRASSHPPTPPSTPTDPQSPAPAHRLAPTGMAAAWLR